MTTLTATGLMILAALAVWLRPRLRLATLLIFSVFFVYLLQPQSSALDIILPTATILLVVGTWGVVTSAPTADDGRWLLIISAIALLGAEFKALISNAQPDVLASVLQVAPGLALAGIGTLGLGAVLPTSDQAARRRIALVALLFIMGVFIVLKLPVLQGALTQNALPAWNWIGFSYIAFRLLHVLLDYRIGRLAPLSLRDFALYVTFFPAITAGPIARTEQFAPELDNARRFDTERILSGGTRIGIGLFKKFILADSLALISLNSSLVEQTHSTAALWVMVYAYAFQLFFDFSGYVDIAIGIGKLAGITLPENFNAPYLKRNLAAFWNSWHMTLSAWFRAYFFGPISRTLMGTPLRNQKQVIILSAQVSTMVLIGLWHGVSWNFVLWGVWHGVGLWLNRFLSEQLRGWDAFVNARPSLARAIHALSVGLTFHFVALGWVFFAFTDTTMIIRALRLLVGLPV